MSSKTIRKVLPGVALACICFALSWSGRELSYAQGSGEALYNGITLPAQWPPARQPSQAYEIPSYLTSPPAVVPIDIGRQLFVDDFLIESTTLTRTAHRPTMYAGNPVLTPGPRDTRNIAMPYSDGVWFDPADNLFKIFYYGAYGNMICFAYSNDGVNWIRPSLPDAVVPDTNMVLQIGGGRDSATVWMDLLDDASRKFKAFAYVSTPDGPMQFVWFSPDGMHWTQWPYAIYSLSDRSTVFYNPFRKVWVESARMALTLPAFSSSPARYSRVRFYLESPDLISWKPTTPTSTFWTGPDINDPTYYTYSNVQGAALPELYNLDATPYESLMVGLFSWYYPDTAYWSYYGPGPNLVELGVGFSRDGFQWVRPTRGSGDSSFIPATNHDGDWNAFNTQSTGGGFLVVGDELWFYFSGRTMRKPNTGIGSTGFAKLRRDGFYSMDAGSAEETLTTRSVTFSGKYLFVNLDAAAGSLCVEILNPQGQVIAPYSKANCIPVSADKTLQQVTWAGATDLAALIGQPVKLRFYLTNGKLYSFWVTPDLNGASHGYVAAGGPGFSGPIDTVGSTPSFQPVSQVVVPLFNPPAGTYSAPMTVSISSLTSGATIRYTTDGSTPTSSSTLYSGPVAVSSSLTLKARAFKSGLNDSDVAVGVYTFARDTTPPMITLVASGAITYSSAKITWSTNEAADSQVDYGTSTAYGSSTALDSTPATSHSQTLTNLAASTQYHYMVKSKDAAGNPATSSDLTFTTAAPPDLTSPAISALTIGNITQIGATISWTTDEPATSRVEYGLSTTYDRQTATDSSLVTAHSVVLTDLNAGTTYHFRAVSADASTNQSPSADQTFTTLAPIPGLTTIRINSGGWADNVTDANGNLWLTDRHYNGGNPSYSSDIIGKIPEFGINATGRDGKNGDFSYHIPVMAGTYTVTLRFADPYYSSPGQRYFNVTINGQQVLTNFDVAAAAGYHLVTSRSFTATATSAGYLDISFKGLLNGGLINGIEIVPFAAPTAATPTIAPVSGTYTDSVAVTMNCPTAGATIRYTTDGTEPGSGSPQYTGTLTFTSSVTIKAKAFATGLLDSPAASAVYTVVARDTTTPTISAVAVASISDTSATVTWTTDEPASSRVEYGLTAAYGQQTALDNTLVTTHTVALSGLTPNTPYHLHALSADGSGNASVSSDQSFTTLAAIAGQTTLRINSGGWGDVVTDAGGNVWLPDRYYSGGNVSYSSDIIGKAPEFGINATGRNGKDGDFSYHIPVTAGTYTVTLRFADPYYSSPGQRYFNVTINGQQVLTNFDVAAAAGYHLVTSRSFTATATSAGYVDIGFKGLLNGGLINGIEIVPFAAPMAATPTIAPVSGTYIDSVAVTMNCSTAGATIRYTTDGSEPGSGSPQYTGTLTFTSSVTIKAKAFATGLLDSPAASAVYTVVARDTTTPTISAVAVGSISDTSATVTWTTDEPASSRVEYGLTAAYGQQTALDNTLTTTHSAALTGLGANTTYHLHVLSADGSGNASASSDQSFTTLAAIAGQTTLRINSGGWGDVVTDANGNVWLPDRYYSGGNASYSSDIIGKAPEFGINATGRNGKDGDFSYHIPVTAGMYTVTLRFADPYYSSPGQRSFNVTINGQQVLTNFDVVAAAGYHLVTSRSFTATATSAGYVDISFKGILNGGLINGIEIVPFASPAAATPTIAPVSGTYTDSVAVTMNCSTAGATIRYTTDGTEPGSGSPQYTGTLTFTSSVTIKAKAFATGLLDSPAASAVYTVVARDTTPPTISAVAVASISDTSATVTWTTDEPASSRVEYGLTAAYGQQTALDNTLVTTHTVALSGLTPNTPYHLHALSADGSGNASVSSDQSFTTLAAIAGQTTLRINSGGWGDVVTDASGNVWLPDRYYSGGNASYSSDIIGKAPEFGINATGRNGKDGDFSYHIPVTAGTYAVTLRFADPYYSSPGQRYFNVTINGQQVLTNFDVVAAAGYHMVTSRSFTVTATSAGYVDISFKGILNGGLINGIEVVPAR